MIPPLEKRNWVHPYYLTRITIFFQTLVKDNQNRAPYPTCDLSFPTINKYYVFVIS